MNEEISKKYSRMYFDRQGKEITLMEWAEKSEDLDYKIIKQEKVGRWFVSTVWIGLNMNLFKDSAPLIFETMIFMNNEEDNNEDDPLEMLQSRYSTEEEAILGHEDVVVQCTAELLIEALSNV